ncbi:MAG: hypothetical protein ACKOFC_04540, partial [Solirubrobacterales bacterium]
PQLAVEAGAADLVLEDRVCVTQQVEALLGRLTADDPDGQARPRERLSPHEPFGEAQLHADRAHLVLEQRPQRLDLLRDADAILQDEIRSAGLYRELWQSFCVLPDVRTVGVQGDERTYGYVVVIRAVTSDDAMTADWARLPYDLLEKIASRMINELRDVNRVVLDITSKPPGTIEWE